MLVERVIGQLPNQDSLLEEIGPTKEWSFIEGRLFTRIIETANPRGSWRVRYYDQDEEYLRFCRGIFPLGADQQLEFLYHHCSPDQEYYQPNLSVSVSRGLNLTQIIEAVRLQYDPSGFLKKILFATPLLGHPALIAGDTFLEINPVRKADNDGVFEIFEISKETRQRQELALVRSDEVFPWSPLYYQVAFSPSGFEFKTLATPQDQIPEEQLSFPEVVRLYQVIGLLLDDGVDWTRLPGLVPVRLDQTLEIS